MEQLLLITATIGLLAGIGIFIDARTTTEAKAALADQLRSATRHNFAGTAASVTAGLFSHLFGPKIASGRFAFRAAATYFVLCLVTLAALSLIAPATFFSVKSGLMTGDPIEVAFTWLLFGSGSLLFIFSAAQTYYILRLASSDARLLVVGFLAYADVILSASICAIGVGALLTADTLMTAAGPPTQVTVQFRARSALVDTKEALNRLPREPSLLAQYIREVIEAARSPLQSTTAVEIAMVPSRSAENAFRHDLDVIDHYLERTDGTRVVRIDEDTAQYLGPDGFPAGIVDAPLEMRKTPQTINLVRLNVEAACAQLTSPALPGPWRYVEVLEARADADHRAKCSSGQPFTLTARVIPELDNIDKSKLFERHVMTVFDSLAGSLASLSQVYVSRHALTHLDPFTDDKVWKHDHVIGEFRTEGKNVADAALMSAFAVEKGSANKFLTNSVPASLIVWAIMFTTVATGLTFGASLLLVALTKVLASFGKVLPFLKIEDHPFSILAVLAGLLLGLLRAGATV